MTIVSLHRFAFEQEMNCSSLKNDISNSNQHDDDEDEVDEEIEWPKCLSTIEEILKMYRVESNGLVQCIRCGINANQDNLLEHVSVHYPYKCYSCG